jgi:protein SCO1/2
MRGMSEILSSASRPGCALVLAFFLIGCRQESVPATPAAAFATQTFAAHGIVKSLGTDGRTLVIQHEAISNYMGAMTMPFEVHDSNELAGLNPGDAISFNLVVTPKDGWVRNIHVEGRAAVALPPVAQTEVPPTARPLEEGDIVPDYHFINQLGQRVHLGQYRGQVIALTFFFTSCPFPNYCPRLTSNFGDVMNLLEHATNAPRRWHLLSISFDPKNDTPLRLLTYAKEAHYDMTHWSFFTGTPAQIGGLANQFGEIFSTEGGSITHNLRTAVIDARGRLNKVFMGNTWTSAELADQMIKAATP